MESLEREGIIRVNYGQIQITNLGAILFARDLSRFPRLSRKAIRVIIYDGNGRLETKYEQLGKFGYAVKFEGLVKWINEKLPQNETLDSAIRSTAKMYPPIAIRELVANALIHQDFYERGTGITIEIFDNRIEITNPGKPLIPTNRFIDEPPQSRNEKLASFYEANRNL